MITLLTDFGLADHYVAAMKGVILSICPAVVLADITHGVAPYAVLEAAYTLSQVWACFPPGTIHVVVVDPGVGSSRRPLLAEAGGHYFIAPDNGVLTMVFDAVPGVTVRHITSVCYFRHPVSSTFHGRDIFAPVAAHLASGIAPEEFGELLEQPVLLELAKPVRIAKNHWKGVVLKIDHFGNIITNFDVATFHRASTRPFEVTLAGHPVRQFHPSYSAQTSDQPFVVSGSSGFLEVSVREGDAAARLGVSAGSPVSIRWIPPVSVGSRQYPLDIDEPQVPRCL